MGDIAFFTSQSYPSLNNAGKKMSAYDMTFMPTLYDVRRFLSTDYSNKAVVSISELFTPYTTNSNFINYMSLAKFDKRPDSYDIVNVTDGGTSVMTIYTNPGSGDARQEVIASDIASGFNYGICPTFNDSSAQIYDKDDIKNINSIALRAPIMLAGFGYTTEGLPTPSLYDQRYTDSSGKYAPTADESGYATYQFADNVKYRPDLWKSGPLDTRWDEGKKMYVAAPEMFIGYALCDIPAASGRWGPVLGGYRKDSQGNLILNDNGDPILQRGYPTFTSGEIECGIGRYDKFTVPSGSADGGISSFSTHKLLIINRSISMDISSGSLVIATRLNNGEYFPIFVDCSPDVM